MYLRWQGILDFRDELSTDDDFLLKGPRIVIPASLQVEYLQRLNHYPLSAKKVEENARQNLHWLGLGGEIIDHTCRGQECIQHSYHPKEVLKAHDAQ